MTTIATTIRPRRIHPKVQRHTRRLLSLVPYIIIIMIAAAMIRRVSLRSLLPSSMALEDPKNLLGPRSVTSYHHSNIGTCQNQSRSTSTSTSSNGSNQDACFDSTTTTNKPTLYRRAVHVIHRHGDRTPITPLTNEAYWTSQLIPNETLLEMSKYTQLLEPEDHAENKHNANGRGPFGKLTRLGLQQMIDLGRTLRHQLVGNNDPVVDEQGRILYPHVVVPSTPSEPISRHIRVKSTNFIRTIQSVQGFLHGLLLLRSLDDSDHPPVNNSTTAPVVEENDRVTIDIRHTNWMIPDPQPRRTLAQAALEMELAQQAHLVERERELYPLAVAMTQALQPLLAPDAREADFGVPQPQLSDHHPDVAPPLSWNQLAEITKCLAVRNLLPPEITPAHQETTSRHAAYRWYESFRHPQLSYYAMNTFSETMVRSFLRHSEKEEEAKIQIWSAHDSSLICLMCAFRLEQPAVWPEYASYLMMELLWNDDSDQSYVRFSLNGQVLRTLWDPHNPRELVATRELWEHLVAQQPPPTTSDAPHAK